MNTKKVFDNVQERIALDNFKIEDKRKKKNTKRLLITVSALTFVAVGALTIRAMSDSNKYV